MLNSAITVKDIQVQNVRADTNPNNDNKIRKSWVLQLPEEVQEKIKAKYKSQEVRFALYQGIDDRVSDEWIKVMRAHVADSLKQGAKMVGYEMGAERLEDAYCVNADEHLIQAATTVCYELLEDLAIAA